ncbi:hypothetical protein [Fibrella aquatilis]|uniref:Uncharacterized protein n=1 Tax=Fibrella aquatilis TaxID=2817059 RepID=A0A939GAZ3_9BACT|nr:hypothetical protein [Fibrella aquatilis]MBO0933317.1 hypothetical protein [Fibrella aquatilis]
MTKPAEIMGDPKKIKPKGLLHNVAGRPAFTDGQIMKSDNTRVTINRTYYNPYVELLRHIEKTRCINITIVNETREKIDDELLQKLQVGLPPAMLKLGSLHVRYKYRTVDNWTSLNKEINQAERVTDIGVNDIAVSISHDTTHALSKDLSVAVADNTRVSGPDRPKQPSKPPGFKVSVYIPPVLLKLIASDALLFAERVELNSKATNRSPIQFSDRNSQIFHSRTDTVSQSSTREKISEGLELVEGKYNNTKDKVDLSKLVIEQRMQRGLPVFDINKIRKQAPWIAKSIKAADRLSEDVEIIELLTTKSLPNKFKGIGTLSNALTAIMIVDKAATDTWSAATIVDGVFLGAGLIAALTMIPEIIAGVLIVTVAYQIADLFVEKLTGKSFGDLWDAIFPRNKPYSPPIYSFIVDSKTSALK